MKNDRGDSDIIKCRPATPDDAAAMCQAERETSRTPGLLISTADELSEQDFRKKITWLTEAGIYAVAEIGNEAVGHASLEPMPLQAMWHVFSLTVVVHPDHTGRGIGSALMSHVLTWAEDNPLVEKVELRVRESNAVARRLYARFGFVEEGRFERRIKLGDGIYVADISMARFL